MHAPSNRGMALIVVLWMVAALSIITGSLLTSVKREIGVATQAKQVIVAGGIAEGAIRRILLELIAQGKPLDRLIKATEPFPGYPVSAEVRPLNGLIDINNAPEALLSAMFQYHAGMDVEASNRTARAVIDARSRKDAFGQPEGFDAVEDLLRIPNIAYDLYARIRSLLSTNLRGGGRVNPQAAPPEVLAVLTHGNVSLAGQLVATQSGPGALMDTTQFNPAFVESVSSTAVEVRARVLLADGSSLIKSWVVVLMPSLQTGLPWQTFETRQQIEPNPSVH